MSKSELKRTETQKKQDPAFTGIIHSLVHKPHAGFADYGIVTLEIVDGIVVKETVGEPYAGFEATARLELLNNKLLEHLRRTYPPEYQHV